MIPQTDKQTTIIRTADGDRLDLICYKFYGHLNGSVEFVLSQTENTHLAELSQPFSAGVLIYLPEMPTTTTNDKNKVVKLWS